MKFKEQTIKVENQYKTDKDDSRKTHTHTRTLVTIVKR